MYRKFSADHIFNGYQMLQQEVLITDAAGIIIDVIAEKEAGEGIQKLNGILCPGFINAHCHLELSHLKGHIPKHKGLVDFVLKVVTERHHAYRQAGFADVEILAAIEAAENEMLRNGIVAVGDICNDKLTIMQKSKGRLTYHNFIETAGFVPVFAQERFDKSRTVFNEFHSQLTAFGSTLNPHAPYSVSPQLFEMINNFPNNNLLTIHNQESIEENEFFEKGTGEFLRLYQQMGTDISFFKSSGGTSLQSWLPHFTKGQTIILVHNVTTSAEDFDFVNRATNNRQRSTFFCLCPNANLYISNILPDVGMLIRHTDNIVLGTDSLASNDQLSILAEIKTLQQNFTHLKLEKLLQWATSNGARALQMNDRFGSFEKGKQPGVVLIQESLEKVERLL